MPIMKPNYCSRSIVTGPVHNSDNTSVLTPTVTSPSSQQSHYGYSTSPFIVYRSAKYDGPHARALQILRGYAKYYILVPVILIANRCKDAFYQVCGLLLLLVSSPLWILMIIGLFIFRRLRLVLIQRLCPSLVELANHNDNSYAASEESLGIVNSIIWTKGRLDALTLQRKFELLFMENHDLSYILKLRSVSKFGAKLWEFCSDFILESHIVEAPTRFQNCPFVDEPLKELYRTGSSNKSILQKYVSFCVSSPLENLAPPWKIHIVPYISRDEGGVREKTCLVIRMHVALIRNQEVQRALRELFLTSAVVDKRDDFATDSEIADERTCKETSNLRNYLSQKIGYASIRKRANELWKSHQIGLKIWANLRLKQLEYHTKTVVLSIILVDAKDVAKRFLNAFEVFIHQLWRILINCALSYITKVQALAAMPMIILASFMRGSQFKRLGLLNYENKNKKLISWSDLIYGDLAEEICEKSGTSSPENVIMMACSYALHDYYQQNNMPNPLKLGFTIGAASCTARPLKSLKAIHVSSNVKSQPQSAAHELKNLEEKINQYPDWKILGLSYNLRYLNYILPSWLANKVHKRIVSCYPFSFTHINLKSESTNDSCDLLPMCQLYGELVEDFTFWPLPPLSDFGVSITLVQYTGTTRLFVMSPFQSLDTVLTHRCNQYLIKMAEDVGVERSKIPYSRRSSPSSTSCSTPHPVYVNMMNNLGFRNNLRRSNSLITT
ncbi:unnamed protein product [Orchesella dallaii]|uniref:O-acyltransferase WSD1 C-terminal domain-containing protein n=1 Tax=Orchesella dallaii TaxID=48710 RepID=A0ABP1QD68_9HEXA